MGHPEQKSQLSLSLYCPVDFFAKLYLSDRNASHNGDSQRYCISGTMGFPTAPPHNKTNDDIHDQHHHPTVDLFDSSTANMMREYPHIQYTVADQDVINRAYADRGKEGNNILIDLIP